MSASAGDYVREGKALLQEKSYSEARIAFSRALDFDPRHAVAHHNIGTIFLLRDQPIESIPSLMTAAALEPGNAEISIAFTQALQRVGQGERAAIVLREAREENPDETLLHDAISRLSIDGSAGVTQTIFTQIDIDKKVSQAKASLQYGQNATAFKLASELIWMASDSADVWNIMSRAAAMRQLNDLAEMSARRVLAINISDAPTWLMLAGIIRERGGRPADIERVLGQAVKLCGADADLAGGLCEVLFASNKHKAGLDVLSQTEVALEKPSVRLMALRAAAHANANEVDEARKTFSAALALEPANLALVGAAIGFYEKQIDSTPMLDLLKNAQAHGAPVTEDEIWDAQARVFLRQKKLDEAHASITRALAPQIGKDQSRSRLFVLAQTEDKRGHFKEAHRAVLAANRLTEEIFEEQGGCDHTMATRRLASLRRRLTVEIQSGTNAVQDEKAGPQNIAFLVGFPRSGTTLLDTILRTHSKVVVVEEERVLVNALRDIVGGIAGDETNFTEAWLTQIDECDPAHLRESYLSQMTAFAQEELDCDKIYIDKLPLNMSWAPLIHKMFPRAVFIFALRHPLDAAVSNLFQDFKPNNAMMNMTSLSRINDLYHASFSLWRDFQMWRRPIVEKISYEDVVLDLEATVSRVVKRLGLDWEEAQSRYFETAIKRGGMKTPSYTQVTQKLYSTSTERWRNYAFAFQGDDTRDLRNWVIDHNYSLDKEIK